MTWWLEATTSDGWTGQRSLPEWPFPGGLLRQPAVIAEAVAVLREEWSLMREDQKKDSRKPGRGEPGAERKPKRRKA